jgi:hypothetical protein
MSKNKNITLDKLADMMESGFEHISGRIDGVEKRIDGVENKMATKTEVSGLRAEMNNRADGLRGEMNRRFDGLEDRVLASHQKRIEKLEAEVKELREISAV